MSIHQQSPSATWRVEARLALTPNERQMMVAIRGAVFLAEEPNVTYEDEFNGNDECAAHFLAYVNGQPVGVIRVRFFERYAALERIGVLKQFRTLKVALALGRAALNYTDQKGYRLVVGRARGETEKLWRLFNAEATGPKITMERGTLTPMAIPRSPVPGKNMSDLQFGDPDVEDLIVQREGSWNFEQLQQQPRTEVA